MCGSASRVWNLVAVSLAECAEETRTTRWQLPFTAMVETCSGVSHTPGRNNSYQYIKSEMVCKVVFCVNMLCHEIICSTMPPCRSIKLLF